MYGTLLYNLIQCQTDLSNTSSNSLLTIICIPAQVSDKKFTEKNTK